MNGYIIVDKPEGMTSFDVIRRLRKCLQTKKIGHGGTLDPMVTGVLPVFVGNATRAISLLEETDKEYVCRMKLGVETDTEDLTGSVLNEAVVTVSEAEVREAVLSFQGEYMQVPPMYSAKKVDGKKLVDLARHGTVVPRKAETRFIRMIRIDGIEMPYLSFTVTCSSGTYVRTLSADIGKKLGIFGAMATLRRTRHGIFTIDEALPLPEIESAVKEGRLNAFVHPTEDLFRTLPKLTVRKEGDRFLMNGNTLDVSVFPEEAMNRYLCLPEAERAERVRIAFSNGEFCGIYRFSEEEEEFVPVRMFFA